MDDQHGHLGQREEHAEETIPGGVQRDDERVAAHDSRSSGEGAEEHRQQGRKDEWPTGHREGDAADDAEVRRAGDSG